MARKTKTPNEGYSVEFDTDNLPHHSFFVGREDELNAIHTGLQNDSKETVVLHGLEGMGKTQLALAHTMRHHESYSAVFWLDATNEAELERSFVNMARIVSLDHPSTELEKMVENFDAIAAVDWAKKWLSSPSNDRWLLIFDNYEPNTGFSIDSWLPDVRQGHVIITTKTPDLEVGEAIHVSKLENIDHNAQIVCQASGRSALTSDPQLHELINELDGLPLALAIAGSFLRNVPISCGHYLKLHRETLSNIQTMPQMRPYGDKTLASAFSVSLRSIKEKNPTASVLLFLWTALYRRDMWFDIVQDAKIADRISQTDFYDAMGVLRAYGFAEEGPIPDESHISIGYTLNRSVHAWLVGSLMPFDGPDYGAIMLDCVTSQASRLGLPMAQAICQRQLPHTNHLLNLLLSEKVVVKDQYTHACQLYRLADIFKTASPSISSPEFAQMYNILQVDNPKSSSIASQEKCYKQVISLCEKMEDQKFKDLHHDALESLAGVYASTSIQKHIQTKWLQGGACRAASHPDRLICSRCLRNLRVHISLWLLLFGMTVLIIILNLLVLSTIGSLGERFEKLHQFSIVALPVTANILSNHRSKALMLSIMLMVCVSQMIYVLIVLDVHWAYLHYILLFAIGLPTALLVALCSDSSRQMENRLPWVMIGVSVLGICMIVRVVAAID